MGRWINRDPIGENGGVNLNIFIFNNSISRIDILGLLTRAEAKKKQKKRIELIRNIVSGGSDIGTCDPACCEKITVIIKLPLSYSDGVEGKGLGGHTGIGIGDDFYDYGPRHGVGCGGLGTDKGSQWWDRAGYPWPPTQTDPPPSGPNDIMLHDIIDFIDHYAHGLDVFKIEMCIEKSEASDVRTWWVNKYSDLGTYWVLGTQCTSTVSKSLEVSLKKNANFSGAMSPLGLLKNMKDSKHTCGSNKDKTVEIDQIHTETVVP